MSKIQNSQIFHLNEEIEFLILDPECRGKSVNFTTMFVFLPETAFWVVEMLQSLRVIPQKIISVLEMVLHMKIFLKF